MAVVLGVLIGLALPLQTTVNTRLRRSVGSPFLASFLSFAVGTLTLLVTALLIDGGLPDASPAAALPPWIWAGGLLGVVMLTTNILIFPHLGSIQTVVLPIAGQVLAGLAIDHFGLFESTRAPLTASRALGAGLLVVGVLGAIGVADAVHNRSAVTRATVRAPGTVTGRRGGPGRQRGAGLWGWRALGLVAGMGGAAQTAINGRLGVELGSAVGAALISFAIGVTTLLLIVVATRTPWRLERIDGRRGPWWMWIGGCLGAAVVCGNAFLAPILGTGLTVMVTQVGMIGGGLLIDQLGLLGAPRRPATALQVMGVLVMVAGVGVIRFG